MATKEVKTALKNARDAIKSKEYKEALKHCKSVLKLEKNNYNAWVFIGVAACELEQPEQAQAAYRKAIELEPEQLLAWQGLASLYEKNTQGDFKAELPNVYHTLLTLYESSDKAKCFEMLKKLVNIYQTEKNYIQVARQWHQIIQLKEESECATQQEEMLSLWKQMIQSLSDSVESQDNETQQYLISAFEKAMQLTEPAPSDEHQKLSADYITCLSKIPHEEEKMKKACEDVLVLYPAQTFPLEALSKRFLNTGVISAEAAQCFTQLMEVDPKNGWAHIGLGLKALQEKKYDEAEKSLTQGLKCESTCGIGWCSLAQAQLTMHRYQNCLSTCNQAIKLSNQRAVEWRQRLLQIQLEALVRCGGEHNADEVLKIISQLPKSDTDLILQSLEGRAYLQKGQVDQAFQIVSELLSSQPISAPAEAIILQGLAYLGKNDTQQAESSFLKALEQCPSSGECNFLLGKLYWDMGDEMRRDKSKAHTHLLKAAKLDPYLGSIFRYLGHYYRVIAKDRGRAWGCYKRAFELDNSDAESGAATVDLSMEQGDMDSALKVLTSVTDKATPGSAKWAWMRRGLYYLKTSQHPQAIADLQAALRADPQDWVCWECLGEAYLNRRSFTAALKAFAKAHQLNPDSIYSLYQMAAIKQTLGKCKEAIAEYMQIIRRADYIPALKGLGECYLAVARGAFEDHLDGSAMDCIQEAIMYLFRAVQHRHDLSCLWKLLGDTCTCAHTASPVRGNVSVPGLLAGMNPPEQRHMLTKDQILKLGERCYSQALKLMSESANLWHDLGLNYYYQSLCLSSPEGEQESRLLLEKSVQCLKKAVMLDSGNHSYWNTLGVIAMSKGMENFAFAQHSFIQSINLEANNVKAWTNLGVLYLKKENIELSHEAFKTAQSLEPLYVNCWIGQALIAETVGSYDTMDLYRHTTELSTHTESMKGYAYCVCSTLLDKSNRDSELYRYNIVQMNAVSAAQVALCKYTERVQTDWVAFVMLGYLNELLKLKRQAVQAFHRAAELVQQSPLSEEHSFTLRNYARALCNTGQWEKAVEVYSSTGLEELHDIVGIALAYYRAGQLKDSQSAYERSLTVASSEKEKAYIMTALALLQHRQGNLGTAKTLLFKCSMLKEPIADSLLSLCALGLVHGDSTLASAALSELLKHPGGKMAVEERCVLTCALLSLQGNYNAVQREASRAVHSNPGNPSLWALLSRVVPHYYPIKADGGAVAGNVACLSSMTQGKNALLHSGINQLVGGRHSFENSRRNALKTIQKAILLCPDDPTAWAALMAACHTENTACLLYNTTPRKQGMELMLMDLVSKKVKAGEDEQKPLARELESWVVKQAISGLQLIGQRAGAEALCTRVLSETQEQPALLLLLQQLQCEGLLQSGTALPPPVLNQLNNAVMANHNSVSAWHWLAEVYRTQGLLVQAVMAYRQSLQLASQLGSFSGKVASLLRLALLALSPCVVSTAVNEWKDLVLEATTEALKLSTCPIALLVQALLQFSIKMGARETRRLLERIAYTSNSNQPKTVTSVARWYLLRHLHAKDDQELMDVLVDEAKKSGDKRLMELHTRLSS